MNNKEKTERPKIIDNIIKLYDIASETSYGKFIAHTQKKNFLLGSIYLLVTAVAFGSMLALIGMFIDYLLWLLYSSIGIMDTARHNQGPAFWGTVAAIVAIKILYDYNKFNKETEI